ncbi:sensor histidine kinase [Hymenobacter chitinivorans]|uniref:histidine kinase n=1 Tax=Hymenobacter chitinivorans DSM 11115 TaxID=1121954 RepID=A0A2M9ASW5_9BACT|nr:PAS domain S-box protein [Hymenobacter chitinivorans]PJJ48798.1 PAS domain S-box-containing protein [Hymenobacter chitinivorans DSM 11115]
MSELDLTWPANADSQGPSLREVQRRQLMTQTVDGKTPAQVQELVRQLQEYQLELEQQNHELQRAQQEAQAARNRYESLYNEAPLGYVTLDAQGTICQLNPRVSRYFKTEPEHLLGRRFLVFVLENYRAAFQDFFQNTLASTTDANHTLKVQLQAADGTVFDARLDAVAVADAAGPLSCRLALADISALQQAIRQRREHQESLNRALTASQQGVWEWSFAGNQLRWDQRAQACFGRAHDPNPVPFEVLAQAVHPDDLPNVQAALYACVQRGAQLDLTHRVVWPDGSVHYVAAFGHVVTNDQGEPLCLSGLMRDVTARYAAEEELGHKNRLLEHILDNLPVILGRLTPEGQYVEMVGAGLRRVGVADNQLVGYTVFEAFPSLVEPTLRLLAGEQINFVGSAEHEGQQVYYQNYGYFDQQRQQGIFFAIDVTDTERAREKLRQERNFIRSLLDHSTDGILAFDQQGHITAWNQAMERFTGKPEALMLSQPLFEHVPFTPESVPGRVIQLLLSGEAKPRTHLSFALPDASQRHFDITAIPLPPPPESSGGGLLILRDVTELNRLQTAATQAQLRQQREVLRAVLTAQEEERRRISEALHNGIGQLLFAAKLNLEHQLHLAPGTSHKVLDLLNEAIRATRMVSFELTPIVLEDFGLQAALQKLTQHLPSSQFQLHHHFKGLDQPRPHLLDLAIYRIVQELLNNVLKHARTTEATLHVAHEDGEVYLSVEDNGVGFTPPAPNKLPKTLGLATIRNRVTLFGGTMQLESRPGQGTIVSIVLPVQSEYLAETTLPD